LPLRSDHRPPQNTSLNITKVAFERCVRGIPSAELTNKEQTCVRDITAAYTSAQQALNQSQGGMS